MLRNTAGTGPMHFDGNTNSRGWLEEEDVEEDPYEDSSMDNKDNRVEDSMFKSNSDFGGNFGINEDFVPDIYLEHNDSMDVNR